MSAPKIGELFAGYGGLGMGVQAALGGELAWYSEIDKGALKILGHRFPNIENLGDITKIDWASVPRVDVLAGGFPCQDVSGAGKRAGIRPGTRSGLWSHFSYAIEQLRPQMVVIENVRGLLSAEAHSDVEPCPWCVGDEPDGALRALGAVLGDLASIGYDASWYGLLAAEVGAPHGRFRVFVIATDTNRGRLLERDPIVGRFPVTDAVDQRAHRLTLLPTPRATEMEEDPATFAARQVRMAEAGRTRGDSGMPLNVAVALLPTPAVNDMGAGKTVEDWDAWTSRMQVEHGNGNGHGKSLAIEARRLLPTPNVGEGGQTSRSGDRINEPLIGGIVRDDLWGDYAEAISRWESLTRSAPEPTQLSAKGTPQLSPAFVEWLMGLPAGWVTDVPGITRNECLKALGNGVVPQQSEAAIRFLLELIEGAA